MSVFAKPVDHLLVTSKEEHEKMQKSCDPAAIERIRKNAAKLEKQIVKEDKKNVRK